MRHQSEFLVDSNNNIMTLSNVKYIALKSNLTNQYIIIYPYESIICDSDSITEYQKLILYEIQGLGINFIISRNKFHFSLHSFSDHQIFANLLNIHNPDLQIFLFHLHCYWSMKTDLNLYRSLGSLNILGMIWLCISGHIFLGDYFDVKC